MVDIEKEILTKLGIELTTLGHDFHDYSKKGSPIDTDLVKEYAEGIDWDENTSIKDLAKEIIYKLESDEV